MGKVVEEEGNGRKEKRGGTGEWRKGREGSSKGGRRL